jgi:hypothetical protein
MLLLVPDKKQGRGGCVQVKGAFTWTYAIPASSMSARRPSPRDTEFSRLWFPRDPFSDQVGKPTP